MEQTQKPFKMEKLTINGHVADNLGSNNYSHGMEVIVFSPTTTTIEQVKELPNVFLHPRIKPDAEDIFALLGTQEQFDEFFRSAKQSYCSKEAIRRCGGIPEEDDDNTWDKIHQLEEKLWDSFKPWYEKS